MDAFISTSSVLNPDFLRKSNNFDILISYNFKPNDLHIWSHPIDVHYAVSDLYGWPKAIFRTWRLNHVNKLDTCKNSISVHFFHFS